MALLLDGSGSITGLSAGGLPDSSITAADIANGAITSAKLDTTTSQLFGMRNRIINGDMRIDQRNAGAATANTINGYTVDRWNVLQSTSGKIIAQQNAGSVTPPAGFTNYLGITSQSAYTISSGDYYVVGQPIEGYNIADFAWGTANAKTITVSFWVRSSLTGTFGGSIQNNANNYDYAFSYTISSANTWEYKTITIAGPTSGTWLTNNSYGLVIYFSLGTGSTYSGTAGSWQSSILISTTGATSVVGTNGATFYITGVQLEIGSTATPFERRMYGQELALCQRYFTTSFDIGVAPANTSTGGIYTSSTCIVTNQLYSSMIYYDTIMRSAPTISLYNLQGGTANQWQYYDGSWKSLSGSAAASINTKGFHVEGTSVSLTNFSTYLMQGGYAATAEL